MKNLVLHKGKRLVASNASMPVASASAMNPPRLLDQVRDVIRQRHYSIRTEQAYSDWIKRFILFHGKTPPQPGNSSFRSWFHETYHISESWYNTVIPAQAGIQGFF